MVWRFEPGEGLRKAFRRVSAEEIAKVRVGLTGPEESRDRAIHEARQAFKRLRALVRLAKPPLGSDFAGENRRWRDAGRLLSGSRDITVLLQCFDTLAAESGTALPARTVKRLRSRIAATGAKNGANDIEEKLRRVLVLLDEAEASVAELEWPNSKRALLHGFHRGQKRLRRDWQEACKDARPDALHCWRKRVKDQSAQLRLFRRVVPPAFRTRIITEKEAAELLGDEHDLWLLSERLRADPMPTDLAGVRDTLLDEIEKRRSALRRQAFTKGEEFSSQKPKAFVDAIGSAWRKASVRNAKKRARKRRPSAPESAATSPPR
jgi:CHAD domain-containing protein